MNEFNNEKQFLAMENPFPETADHHLQEYYTHYGRKEGVQCVFEE